MSEILSRELQRRLDFLDEYIDTLEHDKQATGDSDLSLVNEAKSIQQKAREHYGRGDLLKAWHGVHWAEGCILRGNSELSAWNELSSKIDQLLSGSA